MALPANMAALSDDAKAVAGGHFGFMRPGVGELTFGTPSRITDRTRAALDELVAAGIATVRPFNKFGGLTYSPAVDCRPLAKWLMANKEKGKFPAVHPFPATEGEQRSQSPKFP